ncbi:cold-inducible protein YdjO-related protein [Pseudoneobacillus sp. C159]
MVIFFGKKSLEEKEQMVYETTDVYACSDEHCKGWMRKDYATDDLLCPICGNETNHELRELPKI